MEDDNEWYNSLDEEDRELVNIGIRRDASENAEQAGILSSDLFSNRENPESRLTL